MFLVLAALLFAAFFANVLTGSLGGAPFLGDVAEMLILLAASVSFVAAILRREAARTGNDGKRQPTPGRSAHDDGA